MKPPHDLPLARTCAVCCDVAADAVVRVGLESLPEWRKQPALVGSPSLSAALLKHADEQTLVALGALYRAIHKGQLEHTDFRDWGVVAAPRFLGRPAMAAALQRFRAEGAWGVSPHLIPHRSLHSISGTVSQALKIHGPNFGAGGGPGGAVEGLLAAAAMLEGQRLPGVWVVMTCLSPELPPDDNGRTPPGTDAVGLALALTPAGRPGSPLRLRVVCGSLAPDTGAPVESNGCARPGFDLLRLGSLLELLHGNAQGDTTVVQLLDSVSRIELSRLAMTRRAGGVSPRRVPPGADAAPGSPEPQRIAEGVR